MNLFGCDFDMDLGVKAAVKGLRHDRVEHEDLKQAAAEGILRAVPKLRADYDPKAQRIFLIRAGWQAAWDLIADARQAAKRSGRLGVLRLHEDAVAAENEVVIPDSAPLAAERFDHVEREVTLRRAITSLDGLSQLVLQCSYGLNNTPAESTDAIGKALGYTGQWARKKRASALEALRVSRYGADLALFLDA